MEGSHFIMAAWAARAGGATGRRNDTRLRQQAKHLLAKGIR